MEKILSLKVQKADKNDVGHRVARIDYESMDILTVSRGDVIEITGRDRTVARCKPAFAWEKEKGIIRIDALTRNNAGSEINEPILIRKIRCPKAKKIMIHPAPDVPSGTERYVRDCLEGQPIRFTDKIILPYFEKKLKYLALEPQPFPACVVTKHTKVMMVHY